MENKKYVICIYVRLSSEDDDLRFSSAKKESNSITAQREIIHNYIKNNQEFADSIVIEKCDDGFSGTHFDNRPQFQEMIELAKKGEIDCIIVKDFSRFGRDYIELGDYMEQLLPFLGIRFISVNDNYDSAQLKLGEMGGLDISFKNLVYDYYARETSKKEKMAWRKSAEKGEYRASSTLYGYKKSPDNKYKLVLDPEAAEVVKEIFTMSASGIANIEIAKNLNSRKIPVPKEYKWQHGDKRTIMYSDYADRRIGKEEYLNFREIYNQKKEQLEKKIALAEEKQQNLTNEEKNRSSAKTLYSSFLEEEYLTENMKNLFIEKIMVHPDNRFEIIWKFDVQKYFGYSRQLEMEE